MNKTTYGGRLRNLRMDVPMSRRELAKASGVGVRSIDRLEDWSVDTTNPTLEVTAKLAKALGTTVCFFFTGENCCGGAVEPQEWPEI